MDHAMADGIFIFVHDHRRLVLYQVPFIDHHNQTFVVPLYQLEYVQVLASMPRSASSIRMQTSEFSMARMERMTE